MSYRGVRLFGGFGPENCLIKDLSCKRFLRLVVLPFLGTRLKQQGCYHARAARRVTRWVQNLGILG